MVAEAEVVEGAGLAVEVLEVAASAVVRDSEWGPVSLGADRVSVPECPGTFGAIAVFAMIAASMIGSSSSATLAIRSFTIRFTTAILTVTGIILTDIIRTDTDTGDTDMDTILTINLVTVAPGTGGLPQSGKCRCV
jgi:hypothetical protein